MNGNIVVKVKATGKPEAIDVKKTNEASDFRELVKQAGLVELDDVSKAEVSQFLPQGFGADQLTAALNLYSQGVSSKSLEAQIDKQESILAKLPESERQSLYAVPYLVAVFEEYDPKRSAALQTTFATEITVQEGPSGAVSKENQFVFERREGFFQPVIREVVGKGVGVAKAKVKDFAVKALKKGGKKLAKQAAKKGAGIALKAAVTAALETAGVAVGGPVGAAIVAAALWVGSKVLGLLKKVGSKITDAIFGKRDKGKTIAIIGGLMLLGGILLPSVLLVSLGVLTLFVGGMVAVGGIALGTGVAAYFGAFFLAITTPARAFIAWLIVAIIAVPLLLAFIIFIINSGAYVVPQGPPTVSALIENPYIGVEKVAREAGTDDEPQSFLEYENSDLPVRIEYTITVTAKRATLTNINFDWRCTVIRDPDQTCPARGNTTVNGESVPNDPFPPPPPDLISPANPYVITYEQLYRSGQFNDALIIDTFTVRADVESEGVTQTEAISTASIRIGDPPDQCPQNWPVSGSYNRGPYASGTTHAAAEAVDIGANTGTPVSARHSGVARVFTVATGGPFGNSVEIVSVCPDEQFFSRYSHLSSLLVNSGDFITLGQIVGEVGSTGNSSGPHLHYEFRGPSRPKGLGNPPNMLPPYVDQVRDSSGNFVDPPRGCSTEVACGMMTVP